MNSQSPVPVNQPLETATQRFLVEVWKEVLHVEKIGADSDFFDLGGDSLLALQVYEKVRIHYGREFPLFDLSTPPTIHEMAAIIDAELRGARNKYRTLQRIQLGSPDVTPLFLVHGGDGNAKLFQRLARNLDPRIPVYAFRWTGWDGRRGDTSLTSMAETYLREMLDFHPKGPFRIGGYCIGGLIALEMARQLRAGERSLEGPVYIWDSPNVESASYHLREPWYSSIDYVAFTRMVKQLSDFRRETKGECTTPAVPTQFSGSYELLRQFPRLYTLARSSQIILGTLPIKFCLLMRKPVSIKRRWVYCMTSMYFALRQHIATKYPGDVIYFRSDIFMGRDMNLLGWWDEPFLGFDELCGGSFQGYVVGGNHVDVLSEPAGAQVVNKTYF